MKYIWLFLVLVMPMQAHDYLKDLEEQGYCVIPEVLPADEAKVLYNRLWYEFIEQAWPACKLDDRSNWKEAFPIHNKVLSSRVKTKRTGHFF